MQGREVTTLKDDSESSSRYLQSWLEITEALEVQLDIYLIHSTYKTRRIDPA